MHLPEVSGGPVSDGNSANTSTTAAPQELRRRLGTFDAVVIGLGSMIGAGIFAALAPAAHGGRFGAAARAGGGGRRRLLQRDLLGAAGGPIPDLGRHVRVRPERLG